MDKAVHRDGVWGPVTATLDWCEANYQFSHYIAEMANTLSNLFSIGIAFYGCHKAHSESLPLRFVFSFAGCALVGIGSFAFHATLLFQAQLADELPMIYMVTSSTFLLFDTSPGFTLDSVRTKSLIAAKLSFDLLFSITYYLYRNPVFHQVVFASIMIANALRVFFLLRWSEASDHITLETRVIISRLFITGVATFAFGFFIWNLDNIFCDTLTRWKVNIGWPVAFLLEGHAWWHIFTATGAYLQLVGFALLTLSVKDDGRNYTVDHTFGFPYIKRVHGKTKKL